MNAMLVLCQDCAQLLGCTDPEDKTCTRCQTHDCPFLPAPQLARGLCARCGASRVNTVWGSSSRRQSAAPS